MTITFWQAFAGACLFLFFWISTIIAALGGVFLGGWFVYRTKREPYEPLTRKSTGEVFSIPIGGEDELIEDEAGGDSGIIPDSIKNMMGAFSAQIGDDTNA